MSCSPQALGFLLPTACVVSSALAANQANSASASAESAACQGSSLPARQAYSHSASDGRR